MWVTGCRVAMPSWFDLYSFDIPNRPEDETGLFAALVALAKVPRSPFLLA